MRLWLYGLGDMLGRYIRVWRNVWAVRRELEPPARDRDEQAFLPAHLELTESPVSALPRWTVRLIMLFAVLALVWSWFGHLDIVAVAQGRTIPSGYSKAIQPLETAAVRSIHVRNGQHVQAGDVLLELEGIGSDADYEGALQALRAARLSRLRNAALLEGIRRQSMPTLSAGSNESGLQAEDILQAENLVRNQYLTWTTQCAQIATVLRQYQAEHAATVAQIEKMTDILRIETQRRDDFSTLLAQSIIPKHEYLEQENRFVVARNDLKSEQSHLVEIEEKMRHAREERELLTHTLQRDTLDALRQADELVDRLTAETQRSRQRQRLMTLHAPISGTVQQLAMHTVGGVAMEGQAVMVIAPDQNPLEIEAFVANKDIGFVHPGQEAVIKVESFPYTRYGYLTGRVKSVSLDAIENEDLGLVFSAMISLQDDTLPVDGARVRMGAGMNVTAEIRTGSRRVLDYLLSPLRASVEESMRER